jgi:UDPglucose 6-dehydrogenase
VLVTRCWRRFGDDLRASTSRVGPGLQAQHRRHARGDQPGGASGAVRRGATVTAYDPVAMEEARRIFGDEPRLRYAENQMAALEGADALVIVTEWKEFRSPDFDRIKATLKSPVIFDGRNL